MRKRREKLILDAICRFSSATGRLFLGQRDPLFRLLANFRVFPVQIDKYSDLGPQHVGQNRRQQIVDRPQRIAMRCVRIVAVGSESR